MDTNNNNTLPTPFYSDFSLSAFLKGIGISNTKLKHYEMFLRWANVDEHNIGELNADNLNQLLQTYKKNNEINDFPFNLGLDAVIIAKGAAEWMNWTEQVVEFESVDSPGILCSPILADMYIACSGTDSDPRAIVLSERIPFETKNVSESWVHVDLNESYIKPTRYTLWYSALTSTGYPVNWKLEARSSLDDQWDILRVHKNDHSLSTSFHKCEWVIPNASKWYRSFRLTQIGCNSQGTDIFAVAGFDLYGSVRIRPIHKGITCDICNKEPIIGTRYKCLICPDYDICNRCEKMKIHDVSHPLIKYKIPEDQLQNQLLVPWSPKSMEYIRTLVHQLWEACEETQQNHRRFSDKEARTMLRSAQSLLNAIRFPNCLSLSICVLMIHILQLADIDDKDLAMHLLRQIVETGITVGDLLYSNDYSAMVFRKLGETLESATTKINIQESAIEAEISTFFSFLHEKAPQILSCLSGRGLYAPAKLLADLCTGTDMELEEENALYLAKYLFRAANSSDRTTRIIQLRTCKRIVDQLLRGPKPTLEVKELSALVGLFLAKAISDLGGAGSLIEWYMLDFHTHLEDPKSYFTNPRHFPFSITYLEVLHQLGQVETAKELISALDVVSKKQDLRSQIIYGFKRSLIVSDSPNIIEELKYLIGQCLTEPIDKTVLHVLHFQLGFSFLHQNDFASALSEFLKAARIEIEVRIDEKIELHRCIAICCSHSNDTPQEMIHLQKAASLLYHYRMKELMSLSGSDMAQFDTTRIMAFNSTLLQSILKKENQANDARSKNNLWLTTFLNLPRNFEREKLFSNSLNPDVLNAYVTLRELRRKYSECLLQGPSSSATEWGEQLQNYADQSIELETTAGRQAVVEAMHEFPRIELEQLISNLSDDIAILLFTSFKEGINQTGNSNYCVARITKNSLVHDKIDISVIGSVDEIDAIIKKFRDAVGVDQVPDAKIARKKQQPSKVENPHGWDSEGWQHNGKLLVEKIFKDMDIGGISKLVIIPVQQFNFLPFVALPALNKTCKFLIEDFEISYLASVRSIADCYLTSSRKSTLNPPMVIYSPNFDVNTKSVTCDKRQFGLLDDEGRSVTSKLNTYFQNVKEFYDDNALKGPIISECDSPIILHISSHGVYYPEDQRSHSILEQVMNDDIRFKRLTPEFLLSPLVRSFIPLAGANIWALSNDDALPKGAKNCLLTAFDVMTLPLQNTELVVLSLCSGAEGDVGEESGVIGIRGAFLVAGAKSLICAQWPVNKDATTFIMNEMYDSLLAEKRGRAESLRQAQLKFIKQKDDNPLFWAAFICEGNPGVLP